MRTHEELVEFVEKHLDTIINDIISDYHWWDGLIEDGELSQEEFDYMVENFSAEVNVVDKNEV